MGIPDPNPVRNQFYFIFHIFQFLNFRFIFLNKLFTFILSINMKVAWLFLFFTALEASTIQDTTGTLRVTYRYPTVGPIECKCDGAEVSGEVIDGVNFARAISVRCTKTKAVDNTTQFRRVRLYSGPDPHSESAYKDDPKLFYKQMLSGIGKKLCTTTTTNVLKICEPSLDTTEFVTSALGRTFAWRLMLCRKPPTI